MPDKMPDILADLGTTVQAPSYFAHAVLRTSNFKPMVEFWKTFLGAHATYENERLAFITYDEEHHRVAILNKPDTGPKIDWSAGLGTASYESFANLISVSSHRVQALTSPNRAEHLAFGFKSLEDLARSYRQRKALGIEPVWCVNHGPTTSLYYRDPDGNKVEVQVDNFDTVEEATAFFHTKEFAENPIGVDFDPEVLIRRLQSGEDRKAIMKRPNIGPRTAFATI